MDRRVAGLALAATVLAGCGPTPNAPEPDEPTIEPTTTDVREHESGPESPIAYGFKVPLGASQVGPLVRYRSARLLQAYKPELDAAQARYDADQQRRRDEAEARGTPPPTPTPTPSATPTTDTFRRLDQPPKPDTTISLMRINGSPTKVVRAMLAQIDVILPRAGIIRSDISKYCDSEERRITRCWLRVRGKAVNGRQLEVTMAVDPGDIETRTAPPASNKRPIMYLQVAYIGDPREGQANRQSDSDVTVPNNVRRRDPTDLIWPSMDLEAPLTDTLLNDWRAPLRAELLLSAYHPSFVVVATTKALDASSIAAKFAGSIQPEPVPDVVEDLNEITTTYTVVGPDGSRGLASYILSARGYYAVLFYDGPDSAPEPEATAVVPAPAG